MLSFEEVISRLRFKRVRTAVVADIRRQVIMDVGKRAEAGLQQNYQYKIIR